MFRINTENLPSDVRPFVEAQQKILHSGASIATCGYKPRNHAEAEALRAMEVRTKRDAARRAGRPVKPLFEPKPNLTLSLRQLVKIACDHPSGGIPIGRSGWPPSNDMVRRAVRRGYATLIREGRFGSSAINRLIPTEKGRAFAARS